MLSVQDPGIGITAEDLASLFEPLTRGRNVGSIPVVGLVLASSKQIVEKTWRDNQRRQH